MRGLRMAVEVDQTHILPVEAVFHSNWWFRNYGMKFSKAYFFDPETRVQSDRLIRQILFDRFPDLDLGEQNAQPRPVVGSVLIAAGYIISAIHGCHVL